MKTETTNSSTKPKENIENRIMEALRGLRFGSVEITVHEGRVVQIERKEKERLNLSCPET